MMFFFVKVYYFFLKQWTDVKYFSTIGFNHSRKPERNSCKPIGIKVSLLQRLKSDNITNKDIILTVNDKVFDFSQAKAFLYCY